jgi:hypothetical protein
VTQCDVGGRAPLGKDKGEQVSLCMTLAEALLKHTYRHRRLSGCRVAELVDVRRIPDAVAGGILGRNALEQPVSDDVSATSNPRRIRCRNS